MNLQSLLRRFPGSPEPPPIRWELDDRPRAWALTGLPLLDHPWFSSREACARVAMARATIGTLAEQGAALERRLIELCNLIESSTGSSDEQALASGVCRDEVVHTTLFARLASFCGVVVNAAADASPVPRAREVDPALALVEALVGEILFDEIQHALLAGPLPGPLEEALRWHRREERRHVTWIAHAAGEHADADADARQRKRMRMMARHAWTHLAGRLLAIPARIVELVPQGVAAEIEASPTDAPVARAAWSRIDRALQA